MTPSIPEAEGSPSFTRQLTALLHKNWIFTIRRWKITLLQLLAPFVFIGFLSLIDLLPKTTKDNPYNPFPQILRQQVVPIGDIQPCVEWNGLSCKTVRYAINNNNQIGNIERFVNDYFIPESKLDQTEFERMESAADVLDYVRKNPNRTTNGIVFSEWVRYYDYTILFNASYDLVSILAPSRKPDNRNELQIVLDRAIFRYHSDVVKNRETPLSTASIRYSSRLFPQLGYKGGKKAVDDIGFVFFYCGIMFQFIILLYNICAEKDLKLRQGLKIIGMKDSVYWFSWFLTASTLAFLCVWVLIISGLIFKVRMFTETDISVNFMLFFLFSFTIISTAFFASTFIQRTKSSLTTGMLVFILGVLFVAIVAKKEIKYVLRDPDMVWPWVPQLLSLTFPFYNLGEAMAAIDRVVNGENEKRFQWKDIYEDFQNIKKGGYGQIISVPMPNVNVSFLLLLANFLFYGLLALYLDKVLPSPSGEPEPWYFFFQKSFWTTLFGKSANLENEDNEYMEPLLSSEEENTRGVQIKGIRKTFGGGIFRKDPPYYAVDDIWLEADYNEVLAILGHNGAGKTTLIRMLTGLLTPTEGDAKLNGLSIKSEMDIIRQQLGVCPQHDILWDDLTAEEHFKIFGALKGLSADQIMESSTTLLSDVNLSEWANSPVRTFSGGMKRRLSVALSFVGSPKVVFLDEPSTGMDPCIRRDLWNLILRMRQDRVIIMTTHDLVEADVLASKVAVMVAGKLQTVGTPIELKNRFAGYTVKVSLPTQNAEKLRDLIQRLMPTGKLLTSSHKEVFSPNSVAIYYENIEVPASSKQEIVDFLRYFEREGRGLVENCSVAQTTLEQVFLRITSENLC